MHYQPKSQLFLEEYNINNTFRVVKFDTLKGTRTMCVNCRFVHFLRKKVWKGLKQLHKKKTCSFFLWQDNANNELYVKLRTCALPSSSTQSYMAFVVLFTFLQLHSLFFLLRFFMKFVLHSHLAQLFSFCVCSVFCSLFYSLSKTISFFFWVNAGKNS